MISCWQLSLIEAESLMTGLAMLCHDGGWSRKVNTTKGRLASCFAKTLAGFSLKLRTKGVNRAL